MPRNSRGRFNNDYDRFEEVERPSRRFKPQEDEFEEDFMEGRSRRRNVSRAIPSAASSRSRPSTEETDQFENDGPLRRRQNPEDRNSNQSVRNNFGERRNLSRNEVKTGSRPRMNRTVSRQDNISASGDSSPLRKKPTRSSFRQQTSTAQVEDASFKDANQAKNTRESRRVSSSMRSSSKNQNSRYNVGTNKKKPRDNSSRFDD